MIKWAVLLLLLAVMGFHLIQIYKRFPLPFSKDDPSIATDARRDKIVSKEHLVSKHNRILNKYRHKQ